MSKKCKDGNLVCGICNKWTPAWEVPIYLRPKLTRPQKALRSKGYSVKWLERKVVVHDFMVFFLVLGRTDYEMDEEHHKRLSSLPMFPNLPRRQIKEEYYFFAFDTSQGRWLYWETPLHIFDSKPTTFINFKPLPKECIPRERASNNPPSLFTFVVWDSRKRCHEFGFDVSTGKLRECMRTLWDPRKDQLFLS